MKKILYLECNSGISGDMTVAALVDAGASEERLMRAMSSIPAEGFQAKISRVKKSGLDACDFDVQLDATHENHDHDMDYLYGFVSESGHAPEDAHSHEHAHTHEHDHAEGRHSLEPGHAHKQDHDEGHHAHSHEHRSLPDVLAIVDACDITEGAREIAHRIFDVLAQAEAKAHGVALDEVHFHEVGAVDSIADVVAAAVCFDDIAPDEVVVTELCEGTGSVHCQHGVMPVPVPAVANIVAAAGIPLRILPVRGELITPTGAAIAAALRTADKLPERFIVDKVGLGAGKRNYPDCSGVVRAMLLHEA